VNKVEFERKGDWLYAIAEKLEVSILKSIFKRPSVRVIKWLSKERAIVRLTELAGSYLEYIRSQKGTPLWKWWKERFL